MSKLFIGLDLGSDMLKISFAYRTGASDSDFCFGKLSDSNYLTSVAIPAVAFFDKKKGSWIYGSAVNKSSNESYVTVVKIKTLLSLLSEKENEQVTVSNKNYYWKKNHFPKFFFPIRRSLIEDFGGEMVDKNRTFTVLDYTPSKVCEEFFKYVEGVVDSRVKALEQKRGLKFYGLDIAVVHPPKVGGEYVDELKRLVENAFGRGSVVKVLNSTKAISLFAAELKMIKPDESFLVFDMGEEDISVAQATFSSRYGVLIDGVDGHSEPIELGGLNVDEAIYDYIEDSIKERETVGTPSAGKDGHIYENSVFAKQYLLMKEIKKSKVALSYKGGNYFPKGVPLSIYREVVLQKNLTLSEFQSATLDIVKKISRYVIDELKRPINDKVKKVVLSGGLVETYSLFGYIESEAAKFCPTKKILTVATNAPKDEFDLKDNEDASYSAAIGGAIVALKDIEIKTMLSLSYGTWTGNTANKSLKIFAERGSILPPDGSDFYTTEISLLSATVDDEEIYSLVVNSDEIAADADLPPSQRKFKNIDYDGKKAVVLGDKGSTKRRNCAHDLGLETVSGGEANSQIGLWYKGTRVLKITPVTFQKNVMFKEGIKVDKNGRATPTIEICESCHRYLFDISCVNGYEGRVSGKELSIYFLSVKSFNTRMG